MPSEAVKKWLDRVEYDFQTAEAMLGAARYIYVIFMCQQAVEKALKAVITSRGEEVMPIHNLRRLAELAKMEFKEDELVKLDFLSQFYLNARYKEDLADVSKGITRQVSEEFLAFTKESVKWISDAIA